MKELRWTNDILKTTSAFFAQAELDRYRDTYEVEPICKVVQITPSCYRGHIAQVRNPASRCGRAQHGTRA